MHDGRSQLPKDRARPHARAGSHGGKAAVRGSGAVAAEEQVAGAGARVGSETGGLWGASSVPSMTQMAIFSKMGRSSSCFTGSDSIVCAHPPALVALHVIEHCANGARVVHTPECELQVDVDATARFPITGAGKFVIPVPSYMTCDWKR